MCHDGPLGFRTACVFDAGIWSTERFCDGDGSVADANVLRVTKALGRRGGPSAVGKTYMLCEEDGRDRRGRYLWNVGKVCNSANYITVNPAAGQKRQCT